MFFWQEVESLCRRLLDICVNKCHIIWTIKLTSTAHWLEQSLRVKVYCLVTSMISLKDLTSHCNETASNLRKSTESCFWIQSSGSDLWAECDYSSEYRCHRLQRVGPLLQTVQANDTKVVPSFSEPTHLRRRSADALRYRVRNKVKWPKR